jgi:hypothetical protein
MKHVYLLCLCVLALATCSAQQGHDDPNPATDETQQKAEPQQTSDLHQCRDKVKQWEDWAAENMPIHEALVRDFDALQAENRILKEELGTQGNVKFIAILLLGTGIGFGIGLLWIAIRALRRMRPFSKERKQFLTLLVSAAWISFAAVMAMNNIGTHPLTQVVAAFLFSLPAVTFGSILFWWFGKKTSATL